MNNIKFMSKKDFLIIIVAVLIFLVSLITYIIYDYKYNFTPSIYYRTYTKENGWSKWSKNGIASGQKNKNIINVEFKINNKEKDDNVSFSIYSKNKWIDDSNYKDNNKIYGIKMNLINNYSKDYSICYRSYNKKNKWTGWSCDSYINGNKKVPMSQIEVKIISKNVIKNDYLKDYNYLLGKEQFNF